MGRRGEDKGRLAAGPRPSDGGVKAAVAPSTRRWSWSTACFRSSPAARASTAGRCRSPASTTIWGSASRPAPGWRTRASTRVAVKDVGDFLDGRQEQIVKKLRAGDGRGRREPGVRAGRAAARPAAGGRRGVAAAEGDHHGADRSGRDRGRRGRHRPERRLRADVLHSRRQADRAEPFPGRRHRRGDAGRGRVRSS